tara:strand:- start:1486 stop:1824 length:339 start_codon:yes stop_codon:yes gene_type:complete
MRITKRQLRRIIKEEKAKLIKESVADETQYQDMFEKAAMEVSDKFYNDMMALFEQEPEEFAASPFARTPKSSWEQQLLMAQQEINTGIADAMRAVVEQTEMRLSDGQYDDGR